MNIYTETVVYVSLKCLKSLKHFLSYGIFNISTTDIFIALILVYSHHKVGLCNLLSKYKFKQTDEYTLPQLITNTKRTIIFKNKG